MMKQLKNMYHYVLAWYGAVKYHHPSDELFVIGITGTSGKSSTVYFLRQVLEAAGWRVGSLSTIDFYIAGEDKLNDQKMTMLGRMQIQKYLREMVSKKCDIAIIEMTSEGAVQHRNKFINVDTMVLTNLYPEHIESHGSFENYKKAKLSLFEYVAKSRRKDVKNLQTCKLANLQTITKMAIVNGDNEYASEFLEFGFEKKLTFGRNEQLTMSLPAGKAGNEQVTKDGLKFEVEGRMFEPKLYGKHTVMNLLCVITIARSLNIDWETIQKAVNNLHGAPGRVEFIAEAEQAGLQVIVDYAFEPVALQGLYSIVEILAPKRVIHVLGGTGGGRDTARRGVMGKMAGEKADIVIVTNEDPYDEDPMEIMRAVATGTKNAGKTLNENLWEILDRKEAIRKAVALARPGDLVLVTGKGSEQAMCLAGEKKIPWDDRLVVRDVLNNS